MLKRPYILVNPAVWLKLKIYIQHFFTGPVRLGWLFSCILNELVILKMFG